MAAATTPPLEVTVALARLARASGANTPSATNLWGTPRTAASKRSGTTPVATALLVEATAAAAAAEVEASAPRSLMMHRGALLLLRLIK